MILFLQIIFNHLHQLSSLVFQAMYLPWVLFGFNLIIQGSGVMELIGILIGHLYFFLMFKYPQDFGGASLLKTPQIFYEWFPNQAGGVHGFGGGQTTGIDTKSNHIIQIFLEPSDEVPTSGPFIRTRSHEQEGRGLTF